MRLNTGNRLIVLKVVILGVILAGCGGGGGAGDSAVAYKLYGVNFSPYVDGQNPEQGSVVSESQLRDRIGILAGRTDRIRTFGSTRGLERAGAVAREFGLTAVLQAWIGSDTAANELELASLITLGQSGDAEMLIVGSEVLLRNDLSATALIALINRVKAAVPGVPVAYADTCATLLANPEVIAAMDVVMVNYYPYWEGVSVDSAIATLHGWHQQMVAASPGKTVIVAETGWPSAGNTVGSAVPSPGNASLYFLNFVSWARANNVAYFYFAAFDESWKVTNEGPQGAHWGLWDKDGTLKDGNAAVFEGSTMADNWSTGAGTTVPGGPGDPTLEFTHVPVIGSNENLEGRALHVSPADYRVAVYIYIAGWWTKPTWAQPLTTIGTDGNWTCDITTGGIDSTATAIAAFLVPAGYDPPLASNDVSLPAAIVNSAISSAQANR